MSVQSRSSTTVASSSSGAALRTASHESPIIGIVAEKLSSALKHVYPNYHSYIAASYVKAIQGAGGRVVPLLVGQTDAYYKRKMSCLNGILFPGGGSSFDVRGGYAEAAEHIYYTAKEYNKAGVHYPILGVCLGFELLLHIANKKYNIRTVCKGENIAMNLQFNPNFKESRLYGKASDEIISILSKEPVTANHHRMCITPKSIAESNLHNKWKILTINLDENKKKFVSSIESIKYPFVGIQFHPEKNAFEWKPTSNNPHSRNAILSARHFYDWLVNEARENKLGYETETEKLNELIENHPVFFTGKVGFGYTEVYLFKELAGDTDKSNERRSTV